VGYVSWSARAWDGGLVASNATVCSSSERSRAVNSGIGGTTVFIRVRFIPLAEEPSGYGYMGALNQYIPFSSVGRARH
jgi:hypothetical protein